MGDDDWWWEETGHCDDEGWMISFETPDLEERKAEKQHGVRLLHLAGGVSRAISIISLKKM